MAIRPSRAIGYIRVSTQQQADSQLGLEAQHAAITDAAQRLKTTLAQVCADAGLSDTLDIADRPGLADALNALRRGDTLIVAKRDRLARDVFLSVLIEREVQRWALASCQPPAKAPKPMMPVPSSRDASSMPSRSSSVP